MSTPSDSTWSPIRGWVPECAGSRYDQGLGHLLTLVTCLPTMLAGSVKGPWLSERLDSSPLTSGTSHILRKQRPCVADSGVTLENSRQNGTLLAWSSPLHDPDGDLHRRDSRSNWRPVGGPGPATPSFVPPSPGPSAPRDLGRDAAVAPGATLVPYTFGDSDWARADRPAVAVIRFNRYREARRATYELLVALGLARDGGHATTA